MICSSPKRRYVRAVALLFLTKMMLFSSYHQYFYDELIITRVNNGTHYRHDSMLKTPTEGSVPKFSPLVAIVISDLLDFSRYAVTRATFGTSTTI